MIVTLIPPLKAIRGGMSFFGPINLQSGKMVAKYLRLGVEA